MKNIPYAKLSEVEPVEVVKGLYRKTLTYNEDIMLCYFEISKGVKMPRHSHKAAQIGYLITGKMQFTDGEENTIIVEAGDSYVFGSGEVHGCVALEDSVYIEVFSPARPDYKR